MNIVDLKPCPFCGGKADIITFHNALEGTYKIYIRCEHCGCQTAEVDCTINFGITLPEMSPLDGIARMWNNRTVQEELRKHSETGTAERCKENEEIKREQLEKPVTQVIKEVREKMCAEYCKFPLIYDPDIWEEVAEEVCEGCPLDRL